MSNAVCFSATGIQCRIQMGDFGGWYWCCVHVPWVGDVASSDRVFEGGKCVRLVGDFDGVGKGFEVKKELC